MSAPCERRIAHEQRLVGAQRERLVERPQRALGAHAERRDQAVGACRPLLQPHGLLERVRVVGVDRLLAGTVEPLGARIDPLGSGRVRHLLDAYGDLQRARSSLLDSDGPQHIECQVARAASAIWPPAGRPATRLWYLVSMASPARPAALAALALALVPGAALADTSNIVFPVAGPVDQVARRLRSRQRGPAAARQLDRRRAGHAGRGGRGRAREPALARHGRLEHHADDAGGDQFVYLHLGPRRQPQDGVSARV